MTRDTYIRAVLVVFGLLVVSRVPALVGGDLDRVTLVSTIVELVFLVWGIAVLRRPADGSASSPPPRRRDA
jgi:hypothetical protein